jgi:hypothetical protein
MGMRSKERYSGSSSTMLADFDKIAETYPMKTTAITPSAIITRQHPWLIEYRVFAQPR